MSVTSELAIAEQNAQKHALSPNSCRDCIHWDDCLHDPVSNRKLDRGVCSILGRCTDGYYWCRSGISASIQLNIVREKQSE